MERRFRRSGGQHGMAIMAIAAGSRIRAPRLECEAMYARGVALGLRGMASGAASRFESQIVVRMLRGNIRVTTDTVVGPMHRSGEFRQINKQRYLFAGSIGCGEGFVSMAIHAGAVADGRGQGVGSTSRFACICTV